MFKRSGIWQYLTAILIIAVIPWVTRQMEVEFYLTQFSMAAYYTIVVLSLCMLMGFAGQISLGHGAFFALGGYTSAILTTMDLTAYSNHGFVRILQTLHILKGHTDIYGKTVLAFAPPAAMVAGLLLTAVVALLIGYPSLRLKGYYLAMATLGFGLIVYRLLVGSSFTGAADGINGVPMMELGKFAVAQKNAYRFFNFYLAWGLALAVLFFMRNIIRSRVGRALQAIHDAELAANTMGVNTANMKLQVFVLSAVLSAAAGALMTHYNGGIGPSEAGAMKSIRYVALVAAGGMGSLWGGLAVSAVLNVLSLRGVFGTYDEAVFGLLLILIVALTPNGPLQSMAGWFAQKFGVKKRQARGEL
jgi:branched-chain amino acid transport system permease protein